MCGTGILVPHFQAATNAEKTLTRPLPGEGGNVMSLNDKLTAVKEKFAETAPPEALQIIGGTLRNLGKSGILDKVVREGEKMPPFELADSNDRTVNSAELLSKGPLVVHFYRGVW